MKKYNEFQRMTNLINRAITEFGYEYDASDSLQEIYDEATNLINDYVGCDRIEECEMSNHHTHLTWNDGMGFTLEADGDFINAKAKDNTWMRKQSDGSFVAIDWFEADEESDYVIAHYEFDSEGQVVALVCK